MPAATIVERFAGWAADLSVADIPEAVRVRSDAQRDGVLAAVAASRCHDQAWRRVAAGTGDPLYAASASIALDFDDYLCFGHTGHSAVLIPEFVGDEVEADAEQRLVAQVIANEVGARISGACLIGPLNGQMWSFVHAASAALAAGRLLGLDVQQLAHALAIALYQPPRPAVPGFMAPDSKLLTAAEPTLAGVHAARLAAAGVTGPLDILDHPRGFLAAFAYAPMAMLLGGLGEGWATRTLSVKPYPGCAYAGTIIDALLTLGPPHAEEVASVDIDAGLLTCGMDAWSSGWAMGEPTPVTVTFSVAWNVAVTLVAGRLSPMEVNSPWLRAHHVELADLATRVNLRHDRSLTAASAAAFAPLLPSAAVLRSAGRIGLARGVRALQREHASLGLRPVEAIAMVLSIVERRLTSRGLQFWDDQELAAFRMVLPARVRVRLRDGREVVTEADVPRGAAGNDACPPERTAAAKRHEWPSPGLRQPLTDPPDSPARPVYELGSAKPPARAGVRE